VKFQFSWIFLPQGNNTEQSKRYLISYRFSIGIVHLDVKGLKFILYTMKVITKNFFKQIQNSHLTK